MENKDRFSLPVIMMGVLLLLDIAHSPALYKANEGLDIIVS